MVPSKNKFEPNSFLRKKMDVKKYLNYGYLEKIIFDPHSILPVCVLVFIIEICLNIFIIEKVPYTEIDWKAYMQEVEYVLNGTLDYKLIKGEILISIMNFTFFHFLGDTGPLVYPAGFVYIYTAFYYITSHGTNIHLGQYIFLALYLLQTFLFQRILLKTCKVPPYALIIGFLTSYRIHSIFVLRLFNDPIAVILFYVSLNLFLSGKWKLGSLVYSLAVSVKMNILLYAPCLLIAYLTNLTYSQTVYNLFICAAVQLILGLPFLLTHPISYIKGSFDLGRIFEHKWTVNYRFLPRDVFESYRFHFLLLVCHIALLLLFTPHIKRYLSSFAKLKVVTEELKEQMLAERMKQKAVDSKLSKAEKKFLKSFSKQLEAKNGKPKIETVESVSENESLQKRLTKISQLFVLPFFLTNLIGLTCARSLHYQFYSWYFHSLLYLVFSTNFRTPMKFLLLGLVEYCWNVYPSTDSSSILLHLCHVVLIFGVYRNMSS